MDNRINIKNLSARSVVALLGMSILLAVAQDDSNDVLPPVMVITESVNSD